MSGNRGPSRSSFAPTSGFRAVKLRWSRMATRSPGASPSPRPPAALVSSTDFAPCERSGANAEHHLVQRPALVGVDPAGEQQHGPVSDRCREEAAAVAHDPRLREVGDVSRRGSRWRRRGMRRSRSGPIRGPPPRRAVPDRFVRRSRLRRLAGLRSSFHLSKDQGTGWWCFICDHPCRLEHRQAGAQLTRPCCSARLRVHHRLRPRLRPLRGW